MQTGLLFFLIVVFLLIEIMFLVKGALLLTRYSRPLSECENFTADFETSNGTAGDRVNPTQATHHETNKYYFVVVVYGIIAILRCIEYIPLLYTGLYDFGTYWIKLEETQIPKLQVHYHCVWLLLLPAYLLSLSVPAVGIVIELSNEDCKDNLAAVFVAYCIVNVGRYTWAFLIRVGMVYATLVIKEIWKAKLTDDTNEVFEVHGVLTREYKARGRMVQKIMGIFQTWFLFPWVIFFFASTVEARTVLRPWMEHTNGLSFLPMLFFLLFNINQVMFLLIPYLCGLKMDDYHHKFHKRLRQAQLNSEDDDDECLALQRLLLIQLEDDYNFVPRVWGMDIKVKLQSAIYVIFLIVGMLLTLSGTLL